MKYNVFGIMTASTLLGVYEADSKEEAEEKAEKDPEANYNPGLCWHCSNDIELNEVYELQIKEV